MSNLGQKSSSWVVATLAVALLPQLPRMSLPLTAIVLAPVLWRFAAIRQGWKPIGAWVRHLLLAVTLATLALSHGELFGRSAAVSLLSAMLALKLLECERLRDARIVVSFSFFLCATQYLFGQGLLLLFYGLATTVAGLITLAQLQRNEAFPAAGTPPDIAASPLAELGFGLRLLLLAAPVALAFFVFFPRWASPLWGVPETQLDAKSGLSDEMSPGSIENLFMDDSPAFRVSFDGPVPAQADLYWRGPVFWNYQDNTWSSNFYSRNVVATSHPADASAKWRYTVQMEPSERQWLFALDYPTSAPPDTRMTMDFQLLRRQSVTQLLQYRMASNPDFIDSPELLVTLRAAALELPAGLNPRARELVGRWRRDIREDPALIRRVLDYFNEEGFSYSLQAPLLGQDALDDFLFVTRTGFCEHYASAFTLMMRMAGIPARVVTGYQGGWYSQIGDYLLVRQSDAHAWSEVWLPGPGWTRVDPTAVVSPSRVQMGSLGAFALPRYFMDFGWIRAIRNAADLVEQRWNAWVIDFDAGRQARLLSDLGIPQLGPAGLVTLLFGALAVIGVLLFPLLMRLRGPERKDPLREIWRKFLARLKRAGFTPSPAHGALELASAAAVGLPAQADRIRQIAELYNLRRYSQRPPPLEEIRQAVKRFRPRRRSWLM